MALGVPATFLSLSLDSQACWMEVSRGDLVPFSPRTLLPRDPPPPVLSFPRPLGQRQPGSLEMESEVSGHLNCMLMTGIVFRTSLGKSEGTGPLLGDRRRVAAWATRHGGSEPVVVESLRVNKASVRHSGPRGPREGPVLPHVGPGNEQGGRSQAGHISAPAMTASYLPVPLWLQLSVLSSFQPRTQAWPPGSSAFSG